MFEPFSRGGVGMHTGAECSVNVEPAPVGSGIRFTTPRGPVRACAERLDPASQRATDLIDGSSRVRTVEHLLAALAWCGEVDAAIAVSGPEVPILDGSAGPWIASLLAAGAEPGPRFVAVEDPIEVAIDGASVRLDPLGPEQQPVYGVELRYDEPAPVGPCRVRFRPTVDDFTSRIAPARTFALEREVESIRSAGLGRGGCFDNALIIGEHGPLNPCGARFPDEPARHKLLDAIGDLSLLGGLPWAVIEAVRPGHELMHELVRRAAGRVTAVQR